jgi:hypothetical protein
MNQPVPVIERARRYIAQMPAAVSGAGGHNATLHVACVLVQGFDLAMSDARPLLGEFNARCDPPWSESELEHKLRSASSMSGLKTTGGVMPRGCMLSSSSSYSPARRDDYVAPAPEPKPEYDPERLAKLAAPWRDKADLCFLANRSAEDPALVDSARFLELMYRRGEKILAFTDQRSQGQALWPDEPLPSGGKEGVWILAQPVDGREHANPRTMKKSRRSAESVTSFRYMLLESDEAPMRDWLGLLVQVPLRIEAIYTSGGRSIHALVRLDAPTKQAWDQEKEELRPTLNLFGVAGADLKALSAVRLTRLPGAYRGAKLQKLLYVQPDAPLSPICRIPAIRDVENFWETEAARPIPESDESGWRIIQSSLKFYYNVSERIRQAAADFDNKLKTL